MKHKLLKLFSYGTMLLALSLLLLVEFWLLFPYKPISYIDVPYVVEEESVFQGGEIHYSFKYCKHIDARATIKRWFVDGIIYQSPETESRLPVGCGTQKIALKIPPSLPAGKYKIKTEATIKVNPIRQIIITNETEEFMVLDAVNPERNKLIGE